MLAWLTKEILDLCTSWDMRLFPSHLPGLANSESDALSRGQTQEEWHLAPSVAQKISKVFGFPQVDLFTSKQSTQLQIYFSLDRHVHQSVEVDALHQRWDFDSCMPFLPPP